MTGDLGSSDRRLHGLSDTMRAFAEATADYQRLLTTVAERMAQLVSSGCLLVLLSEDEQSLSVGAVYFESPVAMAVAGRLFGAGPVPVDGSTLGARIIRTKKSMLIPHVDLDALRSEVSPEYAAAMLALDVRSLLLLPLQIRGRQLGLISLSRMGADSAPFNEEDEAVARNLAEHAALAIFNAQLLEARQREIEERKRAQEQAKQFESLIQHSGEFIAMASVEGNVLFVNQAGRKLVGIDADADVTTLRLAAFHTEAGLGRAEIIRAKGRYQGPGQLRHLVTGELIDTQVSSFLVRDSQGNPFCFATVQHDMREMKSLEAHVRQTQRLEALGRLAGGIAHDFNNILSVILSYSTILLMDLPLGAPAREDMQEIHTAGERAAGLTRQLLAFSRQQLLEPRIVDLNAIVTSMEKMTRRLLGEDVVLRTTLSTPLGKVKVDVGQIEQVILNLALNARDAMPKGGVLTLATANVDEHTHNPLGRGVQPGVILSVSDTGTGMDDATRQRAFEPFFTTKPVGKGTGLGLATVFGVVEQSGGHISISSAVGRGTTFLIHLPRCDEAQAAPRVSLKPTKHGSAQTETILLVEDEGQVRKLVRGILSSAGYRVLDAADPLEALRISEQFKEEIQLLVTDVVMPTMNGRELSELLKRTRQRMSVLFFSGYTEDAIAHHGVLDPGIALLQKPVTPDALLQRVREMLDGAPPSSG